MLGKILCALASLALLLGLGVSTAGAASADASCTAQLGGGCPANNAYVWSSWPGSNGYNTYVADQSFATTGSTGEITVPSSPSAWTATADYGNCGGCVQSYTAVNQLTNNWGSGGFNGDKNMPLNRLKSLQVSYTENPPADTANNQYEFAPDLWTNYSADVMMWADTDDTDATPGQPSSRCDDNGLNASDILGQADLSGQNWTVYRYGKVGGEIIMILDGTSSTDPADTDTCANQTTGTLHVLEALRWLSANHVAKFPAFSKLTMGQFDTGYEITAGNGDGQYDVSNLQYEVTIK